MKEPATSLPNVRTAASVPVARFDAGDRWRVFAIGLVACATLLRLLFCTQTELLPEEAYYWNYGRHLALGYLDHPPMVAWLIRFGTAVFGENGLGVRFGALCSSALASFFVYRLTRNLFDAASAWVALVLMQLLPFLFFAGVLMTPDAPLTAAWAGLLLSFERALIAGRGAAWWGVGLALGLGMVSKYTIAMLVPAALLFMLLDAPARRWLRDWRPYAAAVLALVIFSPVIYWNATHEWASFVFQTSRRLAERPRFSLHKLILSALVLLTPAGAVSLIAMRRGSLLLGLSVGVPLSVFFVFSLRHEVKLDWTGAVWVAAVPLLAAAATGSARVAANRAQVWARAAWPPTFVVLVLIYAAALVYLAWGLPGVGYSGHMEVVPVGWRSMSAQVNAVAEDVHRKTGAEPLVVGMDRYEIAGEMAFYAPDRDLAVSRTTSDTLIGDGGLMYQSWFPPRAQQGRNLVLVGWERADLQVAGMAARVSRMDPVQEGTLMRGGQLVRHFYYRVAYDYHE